MWPFPPESAATSHVGIGAMPSQPTVEKLPDSPLLLVIGHVFHFAMSCQAWRLPPLCSTPQRQCRASDECHCKKLVLRCIGRIDELTIKLVGSFHYKNTMSPAFSVKLHKLIDTAHSCCARSYWCLDETTVSIVGRSKSFMLFL